MIDLKTQQILCTAFDKGRVHDFSLFKQSAPVLHPSQLCLADKGYQGLQQIHLDSSLPSKKPRKEQLPEAERLHNQCLARLRIGIEHVNRRLKVFRILSGRYRNRRRRFGLRFNLIAAFLNLELQIAL
jgi:DDE superfamily endonuclease